MKKGHSHICLSDADKHPLVEALHAKGIHQLEIIYTPSWSPENGWDMVNCDKHLIGWGGWLGYTKKGALDMIEKMEVKNEIYLYINT